MDAEAAYKQAIAVQEQFVTQTSAESEHRYELAGTLLDYGDLLTHTTRLPEGEKVYRRGLDCMSEFDNAAASLAYRHRVARLHIHLGSLQFIPTNLTEAEKSHRRGLDLLEEIIKAAGDGPNSVQYREDLADGLTALGHDLGKKCLQRPEEAVDADRKALTIRERLAAEFPAVPEYRHQLAQSLKGLGNHDWTSAGCRKRSRFIARIDSLQKLSGEYAAEPRYRESLADVFHNAWDAVFGGRKVCGGRGCPWKSGHGRGQLVADYPSVSSYRLRLGQSYRNIALNCRGQGKHAGAEAAIRQAISNNPEDAAFLSELAQDLNAQKHSARAIQRQILTLNKRLVAKASDDPELWYELGRSCFDLGELAEAEAAYRRTLAIKPDHGEASFWLPFTLDALDRHEEAQVHWRNSSAATPVTARRGSILPVR